MILKIQHDPTILPSHNSQGMKHLKSCRIVSMHRILKVLKFRLSTEALADKGFRFLGMRAWG